MDNSSSRQTILQIDDVCLSYGERHVLCHIHQHIEANDFIILTGPNGGGKTTLLRLIAGLLPPTCGHIRRKSGETMGYLPQYRHIDRQFPTTVREIVRSGLACRKGLFQRFNRADNIRIEETLRRFALFELADHPISDLSGGQWQRTLLSRAFVSRPDLLLLDEPETHLDQTSRQELYHLLLSLRSECAIVIVSHDAQGFPPVEGRRIWHIEEQQVVEQEEW